ncbi:extracellular solute-binding protein [Paenibacillus qinlingensis]|uniref:Raffinose/stachyose/melibiose transport system substrate-binding protein n=1 Tax=Paenibacillus qinlingensis TaxID=1837343 RepID=A0ABU1NNG2_9BACL|nr:extracellular solute-binding protein [Paenibacillus qinlingensis]MDR6549008.1 raffinose/stachyose/melibiose transport system substrate-binding protein [Paenibacillus qinlingensis]
MKNVIRSVVPVMLISGLVLTACSTKAPGKAANTTTENVKKGEVVTVNFWDNYTDQTQSKAMDTIIANFEKQNANIKIKRSSMKADDQRKLIKPALLSKDGPDLFAYDAGPGYLGVLANANLLMDLTAKSESLGWNKRFPAWIQERNTFNKKVYGVGTQVEMLGVYYNKKIFKDLGVNVPKTYEEFLAICKAAKDKGIVGISLDDKDQWPAFHLESIFYTAVAGKTEMDAVLNGQKSFDQPIFAESLDTFKKLITDGYTTKSPLAISYDDGNKEFFTGKAAMRMTGTWMVSGMVENLKDDVGFFVLPSVKPNLPLMAPGGIGGTFAISSSTPRADETIKFLDYMYSNETAKIWYEASIIPPMTIDVNTINANALFKEVVNLSAAPAGLSYSLDVLMPQKVNDATMNDLQELIAGKKTGAEVVKNKQKVYAEEKAKGNN